MTFGRNISSGGGLLRYGAPIHAKLEIGLCRTEAGLCLVELRFSDPCDDAVWPVVRGVAPLGTKELARHQLDPESYGKELTRQVFYDQMVRAFYHRIKAVVEAHCLVLRLLIRVDESAVELHGLRWELLRDPETGVLVSASENILLSRLMASRGSRRGRLRPRAKIKALVAVAAPSNLGDYLLSPLDHEDEIDRARSQLKGVAVTIAGEGKPLTLNRLVADLREGVDLLYLVCHGKLKENEQTQAFEPFLYLEDEVGEVAVVKGTELTARIEGLRRRPSLVVLASCESAGNDAKGTLASQASIAPRLVEAGVPAVLAMQGWITLETVKQAMPVFFAELARDGQIDRALAVARGTVRGKLDSWVPVLYMGLKSGQIWRDPLPLLHGRLMADFELY